MSDQELFFNNSEAANSEIPAESATEEYPDPPILKEATQQALFDLADELRRKEPWKKMGESDLLGIEDPLTKKMVAISILGRSKQVYALQVYLPEEGIRFWNDVFVNCEPSESYLVLRNRMLECCFVEEFDAEIIDVERSKQFKKANRKQHSLPAFRSHRPGFSPWFVEEDEAEILIRSMALFLKFFDESKASFDGWFELSEPHGFPIIPLFRLKKDGDANNPEDWDYESTPFPMANELPPPPELDSDEFVRSLEKLSTRKDTWEISSTYMRDPVWEEGRPYYPKVALCVSTESPPEVFPEPVVYGGDEPDVLALREVFFNNANCLGYLPRRIRIGSAIAEVALRSIATAKKIVLTRDEEQEILPFIANGLIQIAGNPDAEEMLSQIVAEIDDPVELGAAPTNLLSFPDADKKEKNDTLPEPTGKERYTLKIQLEGSKPPIWRRITIPTDATFFHLHIAIQDCMPWDSSHLHGFTINKDRERILIGPDDENDYIDAETLLEKFIGNCRLKNFQYTYDYGDNWCHKITVEKKTAEESPDPVTRMIKGKGIAPPEDCGGLWGFYDILEGKSEWCDEMDPDELERLRSGTFDPDTVQFTDPATVLRISNFGFF